MRLSVGPSDPALHIRTHDYTACDQLEALIDELDRWAADPEVQLLPAPPEVRAYPKRYLAQARQQLHQAHPPSPAVPPA